MASWSGTPIKIDEGPSLLKMVLIAAASGALLVAAAIAFSYWVVTHNRQVRAAERGPACTAAAQRLLTADTVVALEREKYLLTTMRCDVWRQVQDLRP